MDILNKADALEYYETVVHSVSESFFLPGALASRQACSPPAARLACPVAASLAPVRPAPGSAAQAKPHAAANASRHACHPHSSCLGWAAGQQARWPACSPVTSRRCRRRPPSAAAVLRTRFYSGKLAAKTRVTPTRANILIRDSFE